MTGKDFMRAVSNGEVDVIALVLELLREADVAYCVIGGLAVNAYAEPVASLDLDLVVASAGLDRIRKAAPAWEQEAEGPCRHPAPGRDAPRAEGRSSA